MTTSDYRNEPEIAISGPPTEARDSDVVLEVDNLTVTFPTEDGLVKAVRGVSYQVRRGEALGIVGESGSGKSVTSLAVMGLLPKTARITGSARVLGEEVIGLDDAALSKIRGKRISMIFQDPLTSLNPVYTVGYQLAEAVLVHNDVSKQAAEKRAVELLEIVGIPYPEQRVHAYPHELSGGMRQRVVIAIAMANDPDVIIADEPTTALDVTVQAQVLSALETARKETGAALVLITHDLGVIAGHVDRVNVMYAGKLVESGSVDEIFYRPQMPYTLGLLGSLPRMDEARGARLTPILGTPPSLVNLPPGCPFAPRCPIAKPQCREEEPALPPINGSGDSTACHFSAELEGAKPGNLTKPVLSARNLVKHFPVRSKGLIKRKIGEVHAVCDVSLDLYPHETLGLVGESGCGKSTTSRLLLNLIPVTSGSVYYQGRNISELSHSEMRPYRRELQIVFQDPYASLNPRMTVFEIIAEPLRIHGLFADGGRQKVRDLLQVVGLNPEHGNRYPHEFSGGQRQRIGIARALALRPKVMVLDEPVSALDVSSQAGVINLLE